MKRRLKLEEDLVEMRIMADHLGDNKALFLANLAHDFRTPLNGILGFSQLMKEMPYESIDSKRFKSYIQSIYESAQMLNERIDTCLDPDKIDFGAEPMQMISYPLKNAVNNAMPIVQGLAESANIKLVDDVSNSLPCIHADGRALKKIIVNLVTNAIKHSQPRGTITISAHLAESNDLILTIDDNGVGMDPRLLSALENGRRPEPVSADATMASTGIGLFVVKRLLDLHQATLDIETSAENGTTVTITFPASRVMLPGNT